MNDDRLRNAFAELRRIETSRAPRFNVNVETGFSTSRLKLALAVVVLLVIAVLMIPRRPPAPSISAWRAPTDFLLQTPGRELLNSTPDLKGTTQ